MAECESRTITGSPTPAPDQIHFPELRRGLIPERKEEVGVVSCQFDVIYILKKGYLTFTETCTCIVHYNAFFHSRRTTGMESVRRLPYRTNAYYTIAIRCNDDPSKLNTPEAISFKDLSIFVLRNVTLHNLG